MAITWQNSAGSLGTYPAGTNISLQLTALSDDPSSIVYYKLLSGQFPAGTKSSPIELSIEGYLSGTFDTVYTQTTSIFTVRAYDQYGAIRDRTFNLTVNVSNVPKFTLTSGLIMSLNDSTWTDYQIQYSNPIPSNQITITHTSGTFPPGLYLTDDGRIRGYAEPPYNTSGTPIVKRYSFTLQLSSDLGNDSIVYLIEVRNQRISNPPHSRKPVIYNSRPLLLPLNPDDPYYGFYCGPDNVLHTVNGNEFFTFKVLGHDFDGDALRYSFSTLPTGLVGDPETGWITGTPVIVNESINDFVISVSVSKLSRPLITSPTEQFRLRVINDVVEDIKWTTPSDLGVINNNTVSELFVNATSERELFYVLTDGKLPPNLTVLDNGLISGRVAFQPTGNLLPLDAETEFTFAVTAVARNLTSLRSTKTFTLTVKQYYNDPIENIYFKVTPTITARQVINSLLTDTSLIPTSYLYRPDDFYFGKSSYIKIIQAFGMYASSLPEYMAAIQKNHYYRNIVLGALKTARALDDNGNVLYEVVYTEIIDDLVNNAGISIPEEITWPRPISLNLGPWTINNGTLYSSSGTIYTSYTPGSVQTLYPGSIDNMRTRVVTDIGQNTDSRLLPKWMISQQENGETLGFVKCWVICYTLPGKSSIIKSNIENNWGHTLNEIDCTFDRYLIDKTSTYNWNTKLLVPAWTELPSEVPDYNNIDKHDLPVLFPRRTILPKDNNY